MEINEIISPYFENGVFTGVRVTVGDEDFVIAAKDYQDGEEIPWYDAMDALYDDDLTTWNYRQACFTMAYFEDINRVLVDNGGDTLDKCYWTCTEHSGNYSFFYDSKHNLIGYYVNFSTCSVRTIKNLKTV